MSFIQRFFGADESRSTDHVSFQTLFGTALDLADGIQNTKAGILVTPANALEASSSVYGCVRILSDSVSTLPVDSFTRNDGVRRPFRPRPPWLDFETGPWRKIDVLGQIMVSLLLNGNAYVATYRSPTGEVLWLEVLDPEKVKPERVGAEIRYRVLPSSTLLSAFDILHIRGMTLPGEIEGCSPVAYNRETIALAKQATAYGGAFFGNSAMPGMAAEVPGQMSDVGIKAMKRAWNEAHQGTGNAHKLAVLTEGAKFAKLSLAPEEAQFLQTRQYQVNDVARIYGVPTSLLQHADGPEMGKSLQDKNTHFVQHSLRPWVERIEAAFSWLVRSEGRSRRAFVKINLDGLLRGDYQTRWTTYLAAIRDGALTINEVRGFEDMPPVPWGDEPISVQVQEDPEDDDPPEAEPPDDEPPEEDE